MVLKNEFKKKIHFTQLTKGLIMVKLTASNLQDRIQRDPSNIIYKIISSTGMSITLNSYWTVELPAAPEYGIKDGTYIIKIKSMMANGMITSSYVNYKRPGTGSCSHNCDEWVPNGNIRPSTNDEIKYWNKRQK